MVAKGRLALENCGSGEQPDDGDPCRRKNYDSNVKCRR